AAPADGGHLSRLGAARVQRGRLGQLRQSAVANSIWITWLPCRSCVVHHLTLLWPSGHVTLRAAQSTVKAADSKPRAALLCHEVSCMTGPRRSTPYRVRLLTSRSEST